MEADTPALAEDLPTGEDEPTETEKAILAQLRQLRRQVYFLRRDATRGEMLTVAEIMAMERIKTRETVKARAARRGIPERTLGGGLREKGSSEPLRYSRSEWEAGARKDTRTVKRYARDHQQA